MFPLAGIVGAGGKVADVVTQQVTSLSESVTGVCDALAPDYGWRRLAWQGQVQVRILHLSTSQD